MKWNKTLLSIKWVDEEITMEMRISELNDKDGTLPEVGSS